MIETCMYVHVNGVKDLWYSSSTMRLVSYPGYKLPMFFNVLWCSGTVQLLQCSPQHT